MEELAGTEELWAFDELAGCDELSTLDELPGLLELGAEDEPGALELFTIELELDACWLEL